MKVNMFFLMTSFHTSCSKNNQLENSSGKKQIKNYTYTGTSSFPWEDNQLENSSGRSKSNIKHSYEQVYFLG